MTTHTPGHAPVTTRTNATIPGWLVTHPEVSPGAIRLYAAISAALTDGGAWPTTPELSDTLNVAERTVRAHLAELVAAGAVTRHKGVGYQTGRRYELATAQPEAAR